MNNRGQVHTGALLVVAALVIVVLSAITIPVLQSTTTNWRLDTAISFLEGLGRYVTAQGEVINARTGRTATFTVAASDSNAVSRIQADYVCDDTADNVEIQAALDALPASGGKVTLLEGVYTLAGSLTLPAGSSLKGQSRESTVLNEGAGVATIIMGADCYVGHLTVMETTETASILLGNYGVIENVEVNGGGNGIDVNAYGVKIRNIRCLNIRNAGANGPAINAGGVSAYDLLVDGIYIFNCDRGIEVEDLSHDMVFMNGYLDTVNGYTLDVHTHAAGGAVTNITFKNFYLTNCGGISANTQAAPDIVSQVTFENIRVIDPTGYASFSAPDTHVKDSYFDSPPATGSRSIYIGNALGSIYISDTIIDNLNDTYGLQQAVAGTRLYLDNVTLISATTGDIVDWIIRTVANTFLETTNCRVIGATGNLQSIYALGDIVIRGSYIETFAAYGGDGVHLAAKATFTDTEFPGLRGDRGIFVAATCELSINSSTITVAGDGDIAHYGISISNGGIVYMVNTTLDGTGAWRAIQCGGKLVLLGGKVIGPRVELTSSSAECFIAGVDVPSTEDATTTGEVSTTIRSHQYVEHFQDILAVSTNSTVIAEDLTQATPITCSIASQPDISRNLTINITDGNASITSFTITVTGVGADGSTYVEQFLFAGGLTQTGNLAFATITTIAVTTITGDDGGDVLDVGIGSKLGLANPIITQSYMENVYKVKKNNADWATANYTVSVTHNTVDVSTGGAITGGDDFTVWYASSLNN